MYYVVSIILYGCVVSEASLTQNCHCVRTNLKRNDSKKKGPKQKPRNKQ